MIVKTIEDFGRTETGRGKTRLLLSLGQWKLLPALWALSHFALYRRWAARASKCSTIGYVEGEAAFRTFRHTFRLRRHSEQLTSNHSSKEMLKTFLEASQPFNAKILTTLKTIKYNALISMKIERQRIN